MIWSERRVADMADLVSGFPFESSCFTNDGEVPLVRIRDILNEPFETFVERDVVPESAMIRNGDVVIGMDGDFNVIHWARGAAALNQRLCLLRDNGASDLRFLAYALPAHLKVINDLTYATTVKHLSSGQVRAIRMQAPPKEEQRAIADHLDRETARIDTLIEEQQHLIGMLRERRSALVERVLTSGLTSDAEQADSEIPWLAGAEVPAHWTNTRVKFVADNLRAGEGITAAEIEASGPYAVYGGNGHRGYTTSFTHSGTYVLIGRQGALCGNVHLVHGDFWASEHAIVATPGRDVDAAWLAYMLRFMNLGQYSMTSAQPGIGVGQIEPLALPRPPMDEQRTIAAHLDEQTAKIDELVAETERFIELSHERRAALITAAVTGQIDVREVA